MNYVSTVHYISGQISKLFYLSELNKILFLEENRNCTTAQSSCLHVVQDRVEPADRSDNLFLYLAQRSQSIYDTMGDKFRGMIMSRTKHVNNKMNVIKALPRTKSATFYLSALYNARKFASDDLLPEIWMFSEIAEVGSWVEMHHVFQEISAENATFLEKSFFQRHLNCCVHTTKTGVLKRPHVGYQQAEPLKLDVVLSLPSLSSKISDKKTFSLPLIIVGNLQTDHQMYFNPDTMTSSYFLGYHKAAEAWEGHFYPLLHGPHLAISLLSTIKWLTCTPGNLSQSETVNVNWVQLFPAPKGSEKIVLCEGDSVCIKHIQPPTENERQLYRLLFHSLNTLKSKKKGTWREAYEMCKMNKGTLPIIHAKNEQEELAAMLKHTHPDGTHYFIADNVLFIGLICSKVSCLQATAVS